MTLVTVCVGCGILESRSCQFPGALPSVLFSECHSDQLAGGVLLERLAQVFNHYAACADGVHSLSPATVLAVLPPRVGASF